MSRSRSRWFGALFGGGLLAFAFVFTLLACGALLGIDDERPLRPPKDATSADGRGDGDGGGDAAGSCETNESLGCANACPHEFCIDFDVDGQAPEDGWEGPIGLDNPFKKPPTEAGVEVVPPVPPFGSPPQALHVTIGAATSSSYGMLGQQLEFSKRHPGQTFDGVRIAVDVRIDQLSFDSVGGSPVPDAGAAAILGVLRPGSTKPKGIALLVTDGGFFMSISEDVLGGAGDNVLADLGIKTTLATILTVPTRAELFVGSLARAEALKFANCPAEAKGLVAAATIGKGTLGAAACIEIPSTFDVPAGPKPWAEGPVLLVGGLLFSAGSGDFRVDNVVADFYVK